MDGLGLWWAVAGGWAIDLWLGRETRHHHDVEVVVRPRDQALVHAGLRASWELFVLDPPGSGWRPWDGASIYGPAFQLQARSTLFEFDLFTEDVDNQLWRFRRDHRISLPAGAIVTTSPAGIPILCPEIQLLYMAKSNERKNELDFEVTRPYLSDDAAAWLTGALQITLPGHRWITELR
jgi:hypothetical protein